MNKHKKEKKGVNSILKTIKKHTGLSNAKQRFLELTDIPLYLQKEVSRITIINNNNVLIEQYESVADYFNHYIRIKCTCFDLIIEGKELNIDEINKEELIIKGHIDSLRYKK